MRGTMIAAIALGLAPAAAQAPAAGQDGGLATKGDAPPVTAADVAAAAPHCSGDDATPATTRILAGYGEGGFPIRTANRRAQAFFDNGLQLGHAFAHKASIAAFEEAARLDPECAMCLWGVAWASGPTINYPIGPADQARLVGVVAKARSLAAGAPERDRALIDALALRYRDGGGTGPGDRAYARAMAALAARNPDDAEIAVLAADALMVPAAQSGKAGGMPEAVALLERVLRREPDYTPAIHFYIHATEAIGDPARAERYADRLIALAPQSSHLVHMPSHTWYHVGRYREAVGANVHAVALGKANARRLGLSEPDGVWGLPYHAHNVQYGVGAALLAGDARDALALSDPVVARAADGRTKADPFTQMVAGTAYFAQARFADPGAVLALREPVRYPYARAYWHYARGEAAARLNDAAGVRAEAAAIPVSLGAERASDSSDAAGRMMRIAKAVLEGRAAMIERRPNVALAAFRRAAAMQESKSFLAYADPPAFWYPVRRDVAAALLATGRNADAAREADAALRLTPKDPVTLALRARAIGKAS